LTEVKAKSEPIVIALAIDDADVADRLAAILAGVTQIRLAARGERADVIVISSETSNDHAELDQPLTPREIQVLTLLAQGASNKEIARRLGISVHTAKFHVGQLIDKLDAIGRTDAVAHAARLGVLHL
jgi:DNA-binding CsgD family transcriptional regulator